MGKNNQLRRANQCPLIGEVLFSSVPPSNSLISVSDPWRAFWAGTAPFKGPRFASAVASGTTDIQGHRQVCRAGRRGPRTQPKTVKSRALFPNSVKYIVEIRLSPRTLSSINNANRLCVCRKRTCFLLSQILVSPGHTYDDLYDPPGNQCIELPKLQKYCVVNREQFFIISFLEVTLDDRPKKCAFY